MIEQDHDSAISMLGLTKIQYRIDIQSSYPISSSFHSTNLSPTSAQVLMAIKFINGK